MNTYMVYEGDRRGTFSLNSRSEIGKKYRVTPGVPFPLLPGDGWIKSMRDFYELSLVNYAPTIKRIPVSNEGYLPGHQAAWIVGLAFSLPDPARVVEIGTGYGASLVRILYGLHLHEDAHVWSIDIEECDKARAHVEESGIFNWRYTFVVAESTMAASRGWEPLDMIYVDGSHSYDGVVADIKAWSPHLKIGGIMLFDDYGNSLHEVTPAVDEFMLADGEAWDYFGQVGTMIAFKKAIPCGSERQKDHRP